MFEYDGNKKRIERGKEKGNMTESDQRDKISSDFISKH
jgi:hypothetical protein